MCNCQPCSCTCIVCGQIRRCHSIQRILLPAYWWVVYLKKLNELVFTTIPGYFNAKALRKESNVDRINVSRSGNNLSACRRNDMQIHRQLSLQEKDPQKSLVRDGPFRLTPPLWAFPERAAFQCQRDPLFASIITDPCRSCRACSLNALHRVVTSEACT